MKKSMLFFLFILFQHSLSAQVLVQGTILDENQSMLVGATVVLLEPADSSMVSFGISDNDGVFTIEDVIPGNYVLQVSFVSYKTLHAPVNVAEENKRVNICLLYTSPSPRD